VGGSQRGIERVWEGHKEGLKGCGRVGGSQGCGRVGGMSQRGTERGVAGWGTCHKETDRVECDRCGNRGRG
jgi:hypothetical protein